MPRRMTILRVVVALVGVWGALFMSPWVPLFCMTLLALRFRAWEVLVLGMFMDFVWLPGVYFLPVPIFTLAALALLWGLEPIRKELFV